MKDNKDKDKDKDNLFDLLVDAYFISAILGGGTLLFFLILGSL